METVCSHGDERETYGKGGEAFEFTSKFLLVPIFLQGFFGVTTLGFSVSDFELLLSIRRYELK